MGLSALSMDLNIICANHRFDHVCRLGGMSNCCFGLSAFDSSSSAGQSSFGREGSGSRGSRGSSDCSGDSCNSQHAAAVNSAISCINQQLQQSVAATSCRNQLQQSAAAISAPAISCNGNQLLQQSSPATMSHSSNQLQQ